MFESRNLTDTAFEFKIANLKAERAGIIAYFPSADIFQIREDVFKELFNGRDYVISRTGNKELPYQYAGAVEHLKFFCMAEDYLFKGDKEKQAIIKEGEAQQNGTN